ATSILSPCSWGWCRVLCFQQRQAPSGGATAHSTRCPATHHPQKMEPPVTSALDPQTGALDTIIPSFLAEGEQTAIAIATRLAAFIRGAQRSLDIAIYDFRLSDPLKAIIADALRERAGVGVAIRIAYDADKPPAPRWDIGMDPAPSGTGAFVQSLGYPYR